MDRVSERAGHSLGELNYIYMYMHVTYGVVHTYIHMYVTTFSAAGTALCNEGRAT